MERKISILARIVRFFGCIVLLAVMVGCISAPEGSEVAQTNQAVQVSAHIHKVVDLQSAQCHAQKMLCATNKPVQDSTKPVVTPTLASSGQTGQQGNGGSNTGNTTSAQPTYTTPAAQAVFAQINQQRAGAGLPALTWSTQLVQSAHNHNLTMVAAHQLSHQLPGEADLGTRITRTGLVWSSVAENIGTGTGQSAQSMALTLNQSMFGEQPPDDGHRLNILSQNTLIGVDVIVDGSGQVWLTEDFGRPLS